MAKTKRVPSKVSIQLTEEEAGPVIAALEIQIDACSDEIRDFPRNAKESRAEKKVLEMIYDRIVRAFT